jgi:hypothetical protein
MEALNEETPMKMLTALLVGTVLWLAPVATARAEDKAFTLEGRLQAGAADLSLQLRLETDPALVLRGGLGAGRKQYNFRLRLDPKGVHIDTRPGPGADPRSGPPGLEDV